MEPFAMIFAIWIAVLGSAVDAKYNFDNSYYNQIILDQLDDYFQPWSTNKPGTTPGERPRYSSEGGVVIARWYPSKGNQPAQYQWNWEIPPGANATSAKYWWNPYYYPPYYGGRPYYPPGGYPSRYGFPGRYSRYPGRYRPRFPRENRWREERREERWRDERRDERREERREDRMEERRREEHREERRDERWREEMERPGTGGSISYDISWNRGRREAGRLGSLKDIASAVKSESRRNPDQEVEEFLKGAKNLPPLPPKLLTSGDPNPRHMPFQEQVCCGRQDEGFLLQEDSIREQCYRQVFNQSMPEEGYTDGWNHFSCDAGAEIKQRIMCVYQCMWRLRGTLDNNLRKRDGKLKEYFQSDRQVWRKDLRERAIFKCLPEYDPDKFLPEKPGGCSRVHLDFSYCVWEEFNSNCPERQWNSQSQYCKSLRGYLTKRRSGEMKKTA